MIPLKTFSCRWNELGRKSFWFWLAVFDMNFSLLAKHSHKILRPCRPPAFMIILWYFFLCVRFSEANLEWHTDPGEIKNIQNSIIPVFILRYDSIYSCLLKFMSYLSMNLGVVEFRMFLSLPGSVCDAVFGGESIRWILWPSFMTECFIDSWLSVNLACLIWY